jgi:putative oxidoreductase
VALLAAAQMVAAYFMAHAPQGGLPVQNGGELALLYVLTFAYLAAHGAGRWSLDGRLRRPR